MCVKRPTTDLPECMNAERPDIGDLDIVTDEKDKEGIKFFYLERFGNDYCYAARCFVTIPDQTSEEIEEIEDAAYEPA